MSARRNIDRIVWDPDDAAVNMPLAEFIAELSEALAMAPEEHRAAVHITVEYDSGYYAGDGTMTARAWYVTPETDAEYGARLAEEAEFADQQARQTELRERQLFSMLRQKYGSDA